MNQGLFLNKSNSKNKNNVWLSAFFVMCLVYLAVGFFPFTAVESDGNGIANGATLMAIQGMGENDFSYRYEAQPGSYALVVMLHKLTNLSTLSIFSALSAVFCLVFILSCAALISRLTGYAFPICGLLLLLFQEVFASGYYANSNVIAAAFLVTGFFCAISARTPTLRLLAGVLLGLGAWMRFDVMLIMPALFLIVPESSWKRTLGQVLLILGVAMFVALSAFYLSNVRLSDILLAAGGHLTQVHSSTTDLGIPLIGNSNIKSHMAFFSMLTSALMIGGVTWLILKRRWRILGIGLLGIVPFYAIYWGTITSPKYLLYTLPFCLLFVVFCLEAMKSLSLPWQRVLTILALLLFLGQYILGLVVDFTSKPYIASPYPTLVRLAHFNSPIPAIQGISLDIGAGTPISTVDGDRLSSGILFSPLSWNNNKRNLVANRLKLVDYLNAWPEAPLTVLVDEYDARQMALNILLEQEFRCRLSTMTPYESFICLRYNQVVYFKIMPGNTARRMDILIENIEKASEEKLLFVAATAWEQYLLEQALDGNQAWIGKQVSAFAFFMERRP
jgi:hypothetical protein